MVFASCSCFALQSLSAARHLQSVLTDSGTIQEETTLPSRAELRSVRGSRVGQRPIGSRPASPVQHLPV